MDRKPNHNCRMCGAAYYACAQCDKQKNWRAFCDTPEHYQIFQVLLMYSRHIVDASEAADMLRSLGVTQTTTGFVPQKLEEIRAIFALADHSESNDELCETDV